MGESAGGIGYYNISGNSASLLVAWAMYEPVPVSASQEYYGINVRFDNRRTVGDGACTGCQTGMGFVCNVVALAYGENAQAIHVIDFQKDRSWVCWQCSCFPSTLPGGWSFGQCPTPTLQATWGAIKSLYR